MRDGRGVRRAVPSPRPLAICELPVIRRLLDAGVIVVCAGGGGIPVALQADGRLQGVEAVIDRDLSAALLAEGVGADALVLLTDTPGVVRGWGTPEAALVRTAAPDDLRGLALDEGSMGPKVEAACRFVERSGGWAAIGALEEAEAIVRGEAGTLVRPRPCAQAVTPAACTA